jgi:hypothetical protein
MLDRVNEKRPNVRELSALLPWLAAELDWGGLAEQRVAVPHVDALCTVSDIGNAVPTMTPGMFRCARLASSSRWTSFRSRVDFAEVEPPSSPGAARSCHARLGRDVMHLRGACEQRPRGRPRRSRAAASTRVGAPTEDSSRRRAARVLLFACPGHRLATSDGALPSRRRSMGDNSPKSKQRDKKQKDTAKANVQTKKASAAAAKVVTTTTKKK